MILIGETNIKKIYKTILRPIMKYALEIRAETLKKQTNVGGKWDESTKKNSWKNKNRKK